MPNDPRCRERVTVEVPALAAALCSMLASGTVWSAEPAYPTRPVRMIVAVGGMLNYYYRAAA